MHICFYQTFHAIFPWKFFLGLKWRSLVATTWYRQILSFCHFWIVAHASFQATHPNFWSECIQIFSNSSKHLLISYNNIEDTECKIDLYIVHTFMICTNTHTNNSDFWGEGYCILQMIGIKFTDYSEYAPVVWLHLIK